MEPEATLRLMQECIESGDLAGAVAAMGNYYQWRVRGGFEPLNGDMKAAVLQIDLEEAITAGELQHRADAERNDG